MIGGLLSDSQKEKRLPVLENAYGAFTDWMSWFVISELLGEYFMDERALQTLCRLKALEAEAPRSFVPHGLEHIAKNSRDEALAKKAYTELLQMRNDPSGRVRAEVSESLQRLVVQQIDIDRCCQFRG